MSSPRTLTILAARERQDTLPQLDALLQRYAPDEARARDGVYKAVEDAASTPEFAIAAMTSALVRVVNGLAAETQELREAVSDLQARLDALETSEQPRARSKAR